MLAAKADGGSLERVTLNRNSPRSTSPKFEHQALMGLKLARLFGVRKQTIYQIKLHQRWCCLDSLPQTGPAEEQEVK